MNNTKKDRRFWITWATVSIIFYAIGFQLSGYPKVIHHLLILVIAAVLGYMITPYLLKW